MRLPRPSPVIQFAFAGLLATVAIGIIVVAVSRSAGTDEAIRDAKQVARLAGVGIVQPQISQAVLDGDNEALRELDEMVRERVLGEGDGVVRVKVWSADGRIVYSDEPALIGRRFEDKRDEIAKLAGGKVDAELSDLSEPENRLERPEGKLLEVYLPIQAQTPGKEPLLFEAYQRFSSVTASGRRLWLAFAPGLLGGLLLLQLVNLPLARSLARRLRRGQREREALLRRALDASQSERRLIAADLHDGIVQDLVGVSFSLAAQAARLDGQGDGAAGQALKEGAAKTRESVRALRSVLIDIYPPSLHDAGLAAAVGDLGTIYSGRGLATTVAIDGDLRLPASTEELLFRCAQEGLRNAHRHSGAQEALVSVEEAGGFVDLTVADDGAGFDAEALRAEGDEGRLGLRMLRELVEDVGGQLEVRSAAGEGTQGCRCAYRADSTLGPDARRGHQPLGSRGVRSHCGPRAAAHRGAERRGGLLPAHDQAGGRPADGLARPARGGGALGHGPRGRAADALRAAGGDLRPADREHQYGHGKAEHLAALGESAFLVLVSVFIGFESLRRLLDGGGPEVEAHWWALALLGVVIAIDASRALVSLRVSRRYGSAALAANALHFASDLAGSIAVLVGLFMVRAGYDSADSVAALLVALLVVVAAWRLPGSVEVLMDRAPHHSQETIEAALRAARRRHRDPPRAQPLRRRAPLRRPGGRHRPRRPPSPGPRHGGNSKKKVQAHYPRTHHDYATAFLEQAIDSLWSMGFVGMLVSRSFLHLFSFEAVRTQRVFSARSSSARHCPSFG